MKVKLPLLSELAKGTLSDRLVFSSWKGRAYVRQYVKPHDPKTKRQVRHRELFKQASQAYRKLPDEEKKALNRDAERLKISGFNLFVKRYMEERKEKH